MIESIFYVNPFVDLAKILNPDLPDKDFTIRFGLKQAQSITIWCECFGTVCGLAASIIPIYCSKWKIKFSLKYKILEFMLLLSVLCSGSRAAILSSVICMLGILLYFKFKAFVSVIIVVALVSILIPNLLSEIYNSFAQQSTYGGSNLDMRENQWLLSLYFTRANLLFGTGLGETWTLGHDSGLLGAESILFYTIIDRGFWGIFSILFLYLYMCIYFIKKRYYALCFFVLGFLANKILTLTAGLDETYPLLLLIPLLKTSYGNHQNNLKFMVHTTDDFHIKT